MNLKLTSGLFHVVIFFVLMSCGDSSSSSVEDNNTGAEISQDTINEEIVDSKEVASSLPSDPISFAKVIAQKIESDNFEDWSSFSDQEIFFSPYAFVDTNTLVMVPSVDLAKVFSSNDKRVWGDQDGTGDVINLTFKDYKKRYVNDFDLMDTSKVTYSLVKEPKAYGNEVHNIHELYPDAIFVEAHKRADDDMGMNWRSLIFVLQSHDGGLKVLGLVHNEWTI